jgi:ribosomal protein S18 acetylase RimI-like enzyme
MTAQSLIFVRAATSADSDFLESLMSQAKDESQLYRGKILTHPAYSDQNFCLIAGVGDTSMGALEVFKSSELKWTITFIYVLAECREIGIGDALMQHLLQHAKASQIEYVESSAQPGDRATKNLFERHGLVAQTIIVGKSL